jgi:O-antigen/teichoic acid export membrane protein
MMPQAPDSLGNAATIETSPSDDSGFSARVRNAMAWRWGTQVLAQIITWGSTLMVVRLLDPSDYGLFAMTQVVLAAMAFLNGYSFATSLIQAKDVETKQISQVFGMLILANGFIAAALFLLAPYIAAYYGQPVVADMLRVQAVLFLTVPFVALPSALLARKIQFRNQGMVNLMCAFVGAGVVLGLAWNGFGVWALVYAPIAMALVRALGLTIAARLLVWPSFNFRGAREILSFGGALTLCQLFWIIQSQSDIFIAGRAFDTHELGLYSEALFLTLIVTGRFLPPINEVAFPAYAELHQLGKPLAPFFLRTMRTVLLVTAPIYVGLALTADAAVGTLFGPKWSEMAPIAAGLAIAMPAMALQIVCSPATNAMGSPRIYVTTSAIGAVVYPLVFLIGVAYGPMGLVTAWWIAAPTLLLATLALTLPAVGLTFGKLTTELAPVALACGVMALAVTAAQAAIGHISPPAELLLIVPLGVLTYGATIWFGWPSLVRETWSMLREAKVEPVPA